MTSLLLHTNKTIMQRINYFCCRRMGYSFIILSIVIALNKKAISFPNKRTKPMKLSLKVCTRDNMFSSLLMWFSCFHSFLCSEIHLSKMAVLMFRNDFLKKTYWFLFFKQTTLHHTHLQYLSSLYFT